MRDFDFMDRRESYTGCAVSFGYNCLISVNEKIYFWGTPFDNRPYYNTEWTVDNFYTEITGLPSNVKPLKI